MATNLLPLIATKRKTTKSEFEALRAYCQDDAIPFDLSLPKALSLKSYAEAQNFSKQLLEFIKKPRISAHNLEDFFTQFPLLMRYMFSGDTKDILDLLKTLRREKRIEQLDKILVQPSFQIRLADSFALFKFYCQYSQSSGRLQDALKLLPLKILNSMVPKLINDIRANPTDYHHINFPNLNGEEIISLILKRGELLANKQIAEAILKYVIDKKSNDLFEQLLAHPEFVKTISQSRTLAKMVEDYQASLITSIVDNLAKLDLHLISLLKPEDFYQFKERSERATGGALPLSAEIIQRISRFVVLSLVLEKNKDVRNMRLIQWILIANQLKKLHAYGIAQMIVQSLNKTEVQRLIVNSDGGVQALPAPILKILKDLTQFFHEEANYKAYRAELEKVAPSSSQYAAALPLIKKDLTFSIDGAKADVPISTLIERLFEYSQSTANAEPQRLTESLAALLTSADTAQHSYQDKEQDRAYLQKFFTNLPTANASPEFGLQHLYSGLQRMVGTTPDSKVISAKDFIAKPDTDDLDTFFWNHASAQSQQVLSRKESQVSAEADQKTVRKNVKNKIAGNTFFNRLAKGIVSAVAHVALPEIKTTDPVKTRKKELQTYGRLLAYQEALIVKEKELRTNGPLTPGQSLKLRTISNPAAIHFFSGNKNEYRDQFIRVYFSNWMKYIGLHANDTIGTKPPALPAQVENYFEKLDLSDKHKNAFRWFLSQHPDYLKKLTEQINSGITQLSPKVLEHLGPTKEIKNSAGNPETIGLGMDTEMMNVLTVLTNSVVLWKKGKPQLYLGQHFEFIFDKLQDSFTATASRNSTMEAAAAATTATPTKPVSVSTAPVTPTVQTPEDPNNAAQSIDTRRSYRNKPLPLPKPANIQGAQYQRQVVISLQHELERSWHDLQTRAASTTASAPHQLIKSMGTTLEHAKALIQSQPATFDVEAVKKQHVLMGELLKLAQESLATVKTTETTFKTPSFTRLETQLTPTSTREDLQRVISQNLNSADLFQLRIIAERLSYQLASTHYFTEPMINVEDFGMPNRFGTNPPHLKMVSRAYLTALLFDNIATFHLLLQKTIRNAPTPEAGYALVREKLAQPEEIFAKMLRWINQILPKLAPDAPATHLLLSTDMHERMGLLQKTSAPNTILLGITSMYELALNSSSKLFESIPFSATELKVTRTNGSPLSIDMRDCHGLNDALMRLSARHLMQAHGTEDNRLQMQILHQLLRLTYEGLRVRTHAPTLLNPSVVHKPDSQTVRQMVSLLFGWHALYRQNRALPSDQQINMQAFEELFTPAARQTMQEAPKLTLDILHGLQHPFVPKPNPARVRPCSMEIKDTFHHTDRPLPPIHV